MAQTVVFVAALLLLLLLVISNTATPALHCPAIGVDFHGEAAGIAMPVECQATGINFHAEAAGIVMGHGARPALECQTIGTDVQAEAAGVVMGHRAMPTLACRTMEVHMEPAETSDLISVATSLDGSAANFHFEAKKPSDSELGELKRSRYGDIRGRHSSQAESPAQLLLEEVSVKQLAGKKGTPVSHHCQVPTKVSADVRKATPSVQSQKAPETLTEDEKGTAGQVTWSSSPVKQRDSRIIAEAAGFPSNQEDISNPCQNLVFDFSSLDQRVRRPGLRSVYSTSGNWNNCGVGERSGITARANNSGSLAIQKASACAGSHGRSSVEHTGSVVPGSLASSSGLSVLQYNKKDNADSFRYEYMASLSASPDDTSAQDAGIVKVISAMFSMALLWISVGIKWKTPRKVTIVLMLTALLLVYITRVESVDPQELPPTIPVSFEIKNFDPTFVETRNELVVKTNCPFKDGHYITPKENFVKGGVVQPPRWIRTDSIGESGKTSSVLQRGDTLYALAFFDGPGVLHYMGKDNAKLFPGAHRLPFGESYPDLFDIKGKGDDTVDYLVKVPLGRFHTEAANTVLSDYTTATPDEAVRNAILNYTITLGESQRIKSLGDRLRKKWDTTTFLTREEAMDILIWSRLSEKWCIQDLGDPTNMLNRALIGRGMFSIAAINSTIDLVKRPRKKGKWGRCQEEETQE